MPTNCPHCDHQLSPGAQFCPNCGTAAVVAPDNIGLADTGGTARPPSAPEPVSQWQPNPDHASPTVARPSPQRAAPPSAAPPPAGPPPAGPPPAGPPYGVQQPPGPPNFESTTPPKRGIAKLIGVGLGVVGLGAIGFLAVRFITAGDKVAGGASSPEAVVEEMVAAVNAQDVLAVVSLMAPDELDGLEDLVKDAGTYADQLGLTGLTESDDGNSELVIDIEADRIDVSMEGANAAIVAFELSGDLEVSGGGSGVFEALGIRDGGFTSSDLVDVLPNRSDEVEMIVIKLDGKWFASPMLTGGHILVENLELPPGEFDKIGAEREPGAASSDDAVDALVDVINDPDADELAAILGGGEGRTALVFRDAIDELFSEIDPSARYELTLSTDDLGNGRVGLEDLELNYDDDFGANTITIDNDCLTVTYEGDSPAEACLLEEIGAEDRDVDTSLWLDTTTEAGSTRVRVVPTLTNVFGRFLGLYDDRQTLLFQLGLQEFDEATAVTPGNDVEIAFDGQLYAVSEFPIEEGELYTVTANDATVVEVFLQYEGEALDRLYRSEFLADGDGTARVVTYSEFDEDECADDSNCVPTGDGDATVRIRQAARQSVDFPTVISGDLGPGDAQILELNVTAAETVRIDVIGEGLAWEILDSFDVSVGDDTFDFVPGTYDLVLYNLSEVDGAISYEITPSPG